MRRALFRTALLWLLCGCGERCGGEPVDSECPAPDSPTRDDTGTADTEPPAADAHFGIAERAVVVGLLGARVEETLGEDGWSDAYGGPTEEILPTVREQLVPEGALVRSGINAGVTDSISSWATLLTGARTMLADQWHSRDWAVFRPELPTLFEHLRAQDGGLGAEDTQMVGNSITLGGLTWSLHPSYGEAFGGGYSWVDFLGGDDWGEQPGDDEQVIDSAGQTLASGATLVLASLHQVKRAGSYDPAEYAEAVAVLDDELTVLWTDGIQGNDALADGTLYVLTTGFGRERDPAEATSWAEFATNNAGCREIPMLLLGPGVTEGVETAGPYLLEDLGVTVGWLMGVEQPHATGLVMDELLVGEPDVDQRSGPASVASAGGVLAYQQWNDELAHRSDIVLGDEVHGNPDAIAAERPVLATRDGVVVACWRELTLDPDDPVWDWSPVCKRRDAEGHWEDLGSPGTGAASPLWEPALVVDVDGTVVLAYNADATARADAESNLIITRWSEDGGWLHRAHTIGTGHLPSPASMVIDGDTHWVAYPTGAMGDREVVVRRVEWSGPGLPESAESLSTGIDNDGRQRHERPVLTLWEGTLHLAWLDVDLEGTRVQLTSTDPAAVAWSEPTTIDASGEVYLHIAPRWSDDGWLYWARQATDGAELCRTHATAPSDLTCQGVGAPHVESLAPTASGTWATTSQGDRAWELVELGF